MYNRYNNIDRVSNILKFFVRVKVTYCDLYVSGSLWPISAFLTRGHFLAPRPPPLQKKNVWRILWTFQRFMKKINK